MGKQFVKLWLALIPQQLLPQTAEEVRLTESRVKETKFYSLFRRSHLFNGKICLQYFGCYGLYIKCEIALSKLCYEVWFEYCAFKKKKDHSSPPPTAEKLLSPGQGNECKRDIKELYPLSASDLCSLSSMREAHYAFPTISLLWIAKAICSAEITS